MIRLRNIVLLTYDLKAAIKFYGEKGLGLRLLQENPKIAMLGEQTQQNQFSEDSISQGEKELPLPSGFNLILRTADNEAQATTGYSPILHFDVDNLDMIISNLLSQGGRLDGAIKYPIEGRSAAIRSPEGQVIGLFEPNRDLPL